MTTNISGCAVSKHHLAKINYQREDFDIEAGYYLHKEKLGEGGFSKVRLATHLLTGQKVAVKCMDKSKLGDDLFRVKTEINALKTLDHQHIAKLLQVIETDQMIYLILEYCSGGELFDYIVSKSRLSEKESQQIMGCLVHCLAYLHSMGFAHRDLKPENILFDKNHRIKLIDFGLAAKSVDDSKSLHYLETCCGSPAYAAPELISGSAYSGPLVDVWSAGVILYALLVGHLPFDDENMGNLYKKIQLGKFHIPVWVSPAAKKLLTCMLQIDPKKRLTIRELMVDPWIKPFLPNQSPEVQRSVFDDEVLWQVHKHFPTVSYTELRYNILQKFGYQTATYWLLKEKKTNESIISPIRRQPILISNQLGTTPIRNDAKAIAAITARTPGTPTNRPAAVAVKRRMDNPLNFDSPKKTAHIGMVTPKTIRVRPKAIHTDPVSSRIPVRSPLSENFANSARKRKLIPDIFGRDPKASALKSPYLDIYATPAKKSAALPTPKRNLLQRLLRSATPGKKQKAAG